MEDRKTIQPGDEINDEMLDKVIGGVQAGFFTQGGKGEFDGAPAQQAEETEEEKKKRLMRQAEGKGYL